MIKKIKKIKIEHKWKVFSVFVLFTTVLWFLNALNKEYVTEVKIPVEFILPENRAIVADLPEKFTANVQGVGYNILKYQFRKNIIPLKIELLSAQLYRVNKADTNKYFVLTDDYISFIENQIQIDLSIERVKPDTIHLNFIRFTTKKVPVIIDANIKTRKQFIIKSDYEIMPDSVELGGPAVILDTIDYAKTNFFELFDLAETTTYTAQMEEIDRVSVAPQNINIKIDIEEYTENMFKIPIKTVNVPDSLSLKLFPNTVIISFIVGIDKSNDIKQSDFEVIVDYNSIVDYTGDLIPTTVVKYPDSIYSYQQNPEFVQYYVEKK